MNINKRMDLRVSTYIENFLFMANIVDPKLDYGLTLNIHLLEASIKDYFSHSDELKKKHNIEYTNASKRMSCFLITF